MTTKKPTPCPTDDAQVAALVAAGVPAARARVLLNLAGKAAGVNYADPHTGAADAAVRAGLVKARAVQHYTRRAGRVYYSLSEAGERIVRRALASLPA